MGTHKQKIENHEEQKRQQAAFVITMALRARRFKKLLSNNKLIGNDPGLKALRTCLVRRIGGEGCRNMEQVIDQVCGWYRQLFHNEEGVTLSLKCRRSKGITAREFTYGEVLFHEWINVLKRA